MRSEDQVLGLLQEGSQTLVEKDRQNFGVVLLTVRGGEVDDVEEGYQAFPLCIVKAVFQ